jgi:hypothetical protein
MLMVHAVSGSSLMENCVREKVCGFSEVPVELRIDVSRAFLASDVAREWLG